VARGGRDAGDARAAPASPGRSPSSGSSIRPGPDAFPNLLGLTPLVEYAPSKQAGVIYKGVSLYNAAANHPVFFDVETTGSSEAIHSQKIWYIGLLAGHEY
jgi:hypothetical protein